MPARCNASCPSCDWSGCRERSASLSTLSPGHHHDPLFSHTETCFSLALCQERISDDPRAGSGRRPDGHPEAWVWFRHLGQTYPMRKQYHFWPGEDGLDAWDVDRLVRLTADLPIREVPLETITDVDTDYWFDGSAEVATVRKVVEHVRLIQDVDPSFPIILGVDGRVMDGMHRIARALLDGRTSILAVQFEVHPEPDFRNCRPDELPYDRSGPD